MTQRLRTLITTEKNGLMTCQEAGVYMTASVD